MKNTTDKNVREELVRIAKAAKKYRDAQQQVRTARGIGLSEEQIRAIELDVGASEFEMGDALDKIGMDW